MSQLDDFLSLYPDIKYIWLQFIDYLAIVRLRMVPIAEFKRQIRAQSRPGITSGLFYLLQNDHMANGGSATGQFYLEADLPSLSPNTGLSSKSACVMNFWRQQNGEYIEGCPRTTLAKIVEEAKRDFGMTFLLGFEIEIIFVVPNQDEKTGEIISFDPWHTNHAWSSLTYQSRAALPMIEEIVEKLAEIGINLPQFHTEAAPGQWEFVLPPYSPLQAVDNLIRARQTISFVAEKYGLRATLYPRPYPWTCGSASHAHFSMSPLSHEQAFIAGILEHLPAILAFSMPTEPSYERLAPGIWSGGEYVAWGTQNREVPLRKIEDGHYELKCVDGLANMYFAMAALLGSGLLGVMENMKLTIKDCPGKSSGGPSHHLVLTTTDNVSTLDAKGREDYGITKKLPKTLDESLFALMHDLELKDMLGHDFVRKYNMVKKAEKGQLRDMTSEKRKLWLMERY
jgi:glutamine synthetase